MLKRSGSLALGTIALVSLAAGSAYAACARQKVTPACACGTSAPKFLSFTTSLGSGNCGSVVDGNGGQLLALGCNNLYVGGGSSAVPPNIVPDSVNTKMKVSCCRGKSLVLAAATSADTLSNRNCTDTNCLYGPPLPVVSDISTCVINNVAQPAVGSARCDTGSVTQNLPLTSNVYLTFDLFPADGGGQDHCVGGTAAGTVCTDNTPCTGGGFCSAGKQPCPICSGDDVCHGGPNDGSPCTPGTQLVTGPQWPTSQDCPPPSGAFVGSLPIPYLLMSGTVRKTAVDQPSQNRVFCGFCRDSASNCFEGNPNAMGCPTPAGAVHPCTSDADCTTPNYASCEQRSPGAFGLGVARTVTENGAPAGAISTGGPAASATLASVFCIPPTFNGTIDGFADLPGPGAVSLQGQAQLLP